MLKKQANRKERRMREADGGDSERLTEESSLMSLDGTLAKLRHSLLSLRVVFHKMQLLSRPLVMLMRVGPLAVNVNIALPG